MRKTMNKKIYRVPTSVSPTASRVNRFLTPQEILVIFLAVLVVVTVAELLVGVGLLAMPVALATGAGLEINHDKK
jgi:hypothetical protein